VCCLLHRDRMFPSNTAAARSRRVWEKWFLVCLLSMFFVCFRRGGAPFHSSTVKFLDVVLLAGFWLGFEAGRDFGFTFRKQKMTRLVMNHERNAYFSTNPPHHLPHNIPRPKTTKNTRWQQKLWGKNVVSYFFFIFIKCLKFSNLTFFSSR